MGESRQYLKHGKALCGKVFRKFVETFNWLVDFATNLQGDADVNEGSGHVTVDRSDPSHPVIRCSGCQSGSSGSSEEPDEEDVACVDSLNGSTGVMNIIGGSGISVTTNGTTIMVSYAEGKEADEDPAASAENAKKDPCQHDSSVNGGVDPSSDSWLGSPAWDDLGGMVPAGSDSHTGDDGCNC